MKVFISHAWNNGKPEPKVLAFVNFLRENGYEAECDVLYQQKKTAIHFTEMMADGLRNSDKTIIVLSKNYKLRADDFRGGVGTEYRYIIDDFISNENKYILVSFNGRSTEIIPDFLRGRDIIDLETDEKNEYRELFSKLSGTPKVEFVPVAEKQTIPKSYKIESFQTEKMIDISTKLNLNFLELQPMSDLDKKQFLKNAYDNIIDLLKQLSEEFCIKNPYFYIECDNIDSVTNIFEIYKNRKKSYSMQIWFGNMFGSGQYGIFVGNDLGSKNSFSESIICEEENGEPILHLQFGMGIPRKNLSINETAKYLWEIYFQRYLKMD